MDRWLCCVTLSLLGLGLWKTNAFDVQITDANNKTCIYASMKVNFTIQYDTDNGTRTVTLQAPDSVTASGSRCGNATEAPLLIVAFGNGHSWSLNFTKNDTKYSGDVLTFTYNTSDAKLFPDAKRQGLLTSTSRSSFFGAVPLNDTYKCFHEDKVITENVQQLYWNVTLQAYVQDVTLGNEFRCSADIPVTPSPTAHNTTSATTPKPTTKPVDNPAVGNYFVLNGNEKCLLASMGLQINASLQVDGKNIWTVLNIDPNATESSGSCGNDSALLRLNDRNATVVEFNFILKKNNFHLQEVNVTLRNGSATSQTVNSNLSLWDASVGNSYLCHKEQLISVSEDLHINTFSVRVQPFSVQNGTYSTASECYLDDDSILIPIIVGAALSGLIVIIVVAYLIGRRKTHVGYQTL